MRKLFLFFALLGFLNSNSQDTLTLENIRLNGISLNTKKTASRIEVSKVNTMAAETPAYLSRLGSVNWQSDNGTPYGYSYLRIRGLDQQRINFTVNGIPLNDGEDMGVYTSNITDLISSMKEIRLTRGSGGSLSGTPIFAGSIEMDLSVPDSIRREIEIGAGSFGSYKASVTLVSKDFSFKSSLTGSDGWREHSWGKSASYAFTYRKQIGQWLAVFNSLGGDTRNAQAWLPVPDGMPIRSNLLDPEEKDHFTQNINQLQLVRKMGKSNIVISPYWIRLRGNYSYSIDSNTLGNLQLKWDNLGGYFAIKKHGHVYSSSVGVTVNVHKRTHTGSTEPFLTRPDYTNYGKKLDLSAFYKFDISLPVRIEGDLQVRHAKLDYVGESYSFNVYEHSFLNWRVIASRKISKINLYAMISGSHREPTRTDIFGYNDNYTLSNINEIRRVKPESVVDCEVGFMHKKFRLNAFWMEYTNEIVTMGDINYLGIQVRTNVPKSRRIGVEGEGRWETKVLDFTGNFCFMKAVNVINRPAYRYENPITPFSPKLTLNAMVSKSHKSWKGELWLKYTSSQMLDYTGNHISRIPDFHTLNVNLEKQIKGAIFRLSVNNLLDKPYASSGNVNYDNVNGEPVSKNAYWQSGISFFTSVTFKL